MIGDSPADDLRERVRAATMRASDRIQRSRVVVAARRLCSSPGWMVTRCAWCNRFQIGEAWIDEDATPSFLPADLSSFTTHGICSRCLYELQGSGRSRPLS